MKVLLSILVIIILLLLIKVKLSASFDGENFIAAVRVLFLRKQLFPGKSESEDKLKEKKKEDDKEKEDDEDKEGKGFKNSKYVLNLVKPILGKIRKRLCIDNLMLHFTAASDDAVNTALIYGAACTAIGQIFPVINGNFKIKKFDIKIEPDFAKKNCEITASAVISMAIWEIIYIGTIFLLHMLKSSGSEKENKQEKPGEKESKNIPIREKGEA